MTVRRTLPVALSLALLILSLVGCRESDKEQYVRENERLMESIDEFPGASEQRRTSNPYRAYEDGPVAGYSTNVVFAVAEGTTAEAVIDFYREQLESWQMELEEFGEGPEVVLIANFGRDGAFIQVNTDNMHNDNQRSTFEVVVDYSHND
jgi:hypothetical protein